MCHVALFETTLSKHLEGSLATDEAHALGIPGTENLIILLSFGLAQCPGNPRHCRTSLSLVMLLERLLQQKALLLLWGACELRDARRGVWRREVGRRREVGWHEHTPHHLQMGINETGTRPPPPKNPVCCGTSPGPGEGDRSEGCCWILLTRRAGLDCKGCGCN